MHGQPVILLIPVFNDWESVSLLLPLLERELDHVDAPVHLLLLDDGSTQQPDAAALADTCSGFCRLRKIDILRLQRNLGHQRAIAAGLCHVAAHRPCSAVVVMDADGEDAPHDVPRLLAELDRREGETIIFAERTKRSENLSFRFFYWLYRVLHLWLTGIPVRIGNFSAVPASMLPGIAVVSELWNHYAASVVKSRLPFDTIPTERATRLAGISKMNLVSLVIHGLSAISVFSERTGVRLMIAGTCLALFTLTGLAASVATALTTDWSVPVWTTFATVLVLLLVGQTLPMVLMYVLSILQRRDDPAFLPIRDHVHFVAGTTPVHDQQTDCESADTLESPADAGR
ncbi:MAG: glycosyltransferase [Planctomycetota bacterium]|jgi:hypothetical protein